ncbi:MAG: YHS domain-containing (seleno)protein [Opitutaceae bacterium]
MHSKIRNTLLASFSFSLILGLAGCGKNDEPSSLNEPKDVELVVADVVPEVSYALNVNESGLALHGYDPISYFGDTPPEMGNPEISFEWSGAKWNFVSEENLARFKEAPEKFVPANGGYCTFGIYLNKKFDGDPKVFMENEGAIYLFLNEEVKEKFNQDTENNLKAILGNWNTIKDKSPAELE